MNLCSLNPKSYFVSFINAVSYKLQHLWFTISEIHQQSYRVYSNYVFKKYSRGERKQGNAEEIHQNISGCGIWIIFSFLHLFLYFPNFLQWAYLILLWFRKYNSLFQKSNTKCPRVSEPNLKKKKKKKKKKKTYIRAGWVSEWEILYIKVRLNGVLFCLHGKWFTLEEKCRIGFVRELEIQEFCKVLNGSVFKIYLCLFHFYRFLHFWFLLVALVFKISDPL